VTIRKLPAIRAQPLAFWPIRVPSSSKGAFFLFSTEIGFTADHIGFASQIPDD
jgi:hypothetical protein